VFPTASKVSRITEGFHLRREETWRSTSVSWLWQTRSLSASAVYWRCAKLMFSDFKSNSAQKVSLLGNVWRPASSIARTTVAPSQWLCHFRHNKQSLSYFHLINAVIRFAALRVQHTQGRSDAEARSERQFTVGHGLDPSMDWIALDLVGWLWSRFFK